MAEDMLQQLTERAVDGLASDVELVELQLLLGKDDQAAEEMVELLLFESDLRALHTPDLVSRVLDRVALERRGRVHDGVMGHIIGSQQPCWTRSDSGRLQSPELDTADLDLSPAANETGPQRRESTTNKRRRPVSPGRRSPPRRNRSGRRRRSSSPAGVVGATLVVVAVAVALLLVMRAASQAPAHQLIEQVESERQPMPAPKPVPFVEKAPPKSEPVIPRPAPVPDRSKLKLQTDVAVMVVDRQGLERRASVGAVVLGTGEQLRPLGQGFLTGPDGSTLHMHAACQLRLDAVGQGPQWHLLAGSVTADVRPQAAGHSFLVSTKDVKVRVVGTRFTVSTDTRASSVAVEKGRVRCEGRDGRQLDVNAWQRASVGPHALRMEQQWQLFLVDADTDRVLWERGPIGSGSRLKPSALGISQLNFVVLAPAGIQRVRFSTKLNGQILGRDRRVEAYFPFTVFGDLTPSGDYHGVPVPVGSLHISAETTDQHGPGHVSGSARWNLTIE